MRPFHHRQVDDIGSIGSDIMHMGMTNPIDMSPFF